jgi:hypothetical protein
MKSVRNKIWILIIGFAVIVAACVESYTLEGVESNPNFLVVDGFIDATGRTAIVKLSRAISLNGGRQYPAVSNARVAIESESGDEIILEQVDLHQYPGYDTGTYLVQNLEIDASKQYKLTIGLNNGAGKKYESDFVTVEKAAPIESLEWDILGENVRILVNTKESSENSRFYRWRYDETWEYNAPLYSTYYMDADKEMIFRPPTEQIYQCYREDPSFEILIGSSQNLSTNVLRNYPLRYIPRTSIKLSRLYSINVRQYGLTEEAYTYWLNLYKTTESTGGLFDPMPGQVFGNIHAVNASDDMVVGYFSASTVEEKRIFINRSDLPRGFLNYLQPFCDVDTVLIPDLEFEDPGTIFYNAIYDAMGFNIVGYTRSAPICLDCRRYGGGTLVKPEYWP